MRPTYEFTVFFCLAKRIPISLIFPIIREKIVRPICIIIVRVINMVPTFLWCTFINSTNIRRVVAVNFLSRRCYVAVFYDKVIISTTTKISKSLCHDCGEKKHEAD